MLPSPSPPCPEPALRELLAHKEQEWHALRAQHAGLLEAALQTAQSRLEAAQGQLQDAQGRLQDTQGQLQDTRGRLGRLQADFVHNLQVLEERELELQRYDAALAQARGQEEARRAEASELSIELAKLRQELARAARGLEELRLRERQTLQEHARELEQAHREKSSALEQEREQQQALRWRLERSLEEAQAELALQRQALRLEFESEMHKREQELGVRADGLGSTVLSLELKVKLLSKELEALRAAGAQAAESLRRAEAANAQLETQLQARAWELQELQAEKDARIKALEDKLHSVQLTRKREEETFKRKQEELGRLAREREAALAAVKDAHAEQLRALEARLRALQGHGETLELQLHRAACAQADAAREKDAEAHRLREDAAALRAAWDAQLAQLSREAATRDREVQALREEELKLKAQLASVQQDVERYRQQLALALERERSLQRSQAQLGLDWQRRCDAVEQDQLRRAEALIQGLAEARGQAAAKLQETERALREQGAQLKAVALERDQALETLRAHGLLPGPEATPTGPRTDGAGEAFPSGEIQRLQEQNASLRSTVAQMRREMEALSHQVLPSEPGQLGEGAPGAGQPDPEDPEGPEDPRAGGDAAPPHYVLALEAEMQSLKHQFRALEEQLDRVPEPSKTPPGDGDLHPGAQASAEVAGLCVQPTQASTGLASTGLALRKLGDRVRLLNLLVTQLKQKVQQKPLQLDAARRELPAAVEQVHLEVSELWKQVAELERHVRLRTSPREGGGPPGSQALGGGPVGTEACPGHPRPEASASRLQRKLREAARRILSLRLEKEQLIEMGNRLRAQLGCPQGRLPSRARLPVPDPRGQSEVCPASPPSPSGPVQTGSAAQDPQRPKKERPSERSGRTQGPGRRALSGSPILRGRQAGAALGPTQKQHRILRATGTSPAQKENRSPPTQDVPAEDGHHSQGSPSLASSSLQDTWRLLDLGSSPSGPPSQEDSAPERPPPPAAPRLPDAGRGPGSTHVDFAIKGMKMAARLKATPTRPSQSLPAKSSRCQKPPRVRNYNVRD